MRRDVNCWSICHAGSGIQSNSLMFYGFSFWHFDIPISLDPLIQVFGGVSILVLTTYNDRLFHSAFHPAVESAIERSVIIMRVPPLPCSNMRFAIFRCVPVDFIRRRRVQVVVSSQKTIDKKNAFSIALALQQVLRRPLAPHCHIHHHHNLVYSIHFPSCSSPIYPSPSSPLSPPSSSSSPPPPQP